MNDIYILEDVLYDLECHDYEQAMIDISDLEGGVYDQIKSLIVAEEYADANNLIIETINSLDECV